MKTYSLLVLLPLALLGACSRSADPAAPATPAADAAPMPDSAAAVTAQVTLGGTSGSSAGGDLQLAATTGGVTISGRITGLTPDTVHGFHVHEKGDCSAPDASSAGEHFNPGNSPHGGPDSSARHLGDLPNVQSDATGAASVSAQLAGATLRDAGANDLVGKALIVHAKRDDYVSQPAGDSGDRIACGVIR